MPGLAAGVSSTHNSGFFPLSLDDIMPSIPSSSSSSAQGATGEKEGGREGGRKGKGGGGGEREGGREEAAAKAGLLVCPPGVWNVVPIYRPTVKVREGGREGGKKGGRGGGRDASPCLMRSVPY